MARLHEQLMQVLLSDIAAGLLQPGDPLRTESELAADFGASRGVVRECLRGLEERGVLKVRHGKGATVSPSSEWNLLDSDVLTAVLQTRRSADVLGDFLECRKIIEVEAAGLAAQRADAEDLSSIADAFARMTAAAERAEASAAAEALFRQADIEFHSAIFAASGNAILPRVVEPIQRAMDAARQPLAHPQDRIALILPEHHRILTAIVEHDADEARGAMSDHLATVERYLREYAATIRPDAQTV